MKENFLFRVCLIIMPDIKYPEITKKTSTPINPPVNNYGYA